ncbi:hypothetical protein GW17_00049541 [Ensete ventricosum]|nr:hypothetical protein GW17_00049541 [Ensete ventricosum]
MTTLCSIIGTLIHARYKALRSTNTKNEILASDSYVRLADGAAYLGHAAVLGNRGEGVGAEREEHQQDDGEGEEGHQDQPWRSPVGGAARPSPWSAPSRQVRRSALGCLLRRGTRGGRSEETLRFPLR